MRLFAVASAVLLSFLLLIAGVRWTVARLSLFRSQAELQKRAEDAERRAKDFEARAVEAEKKAAEVDRQIAELAGRVEAAEAALGAARNVSVTVRQKYDEVRNRDNSTVSSNVGELCAELARLNIPCVR